MIRHGTANPRVSRPRSKHQEDERRRPPARGQNTRLFESVFETSQSWIQTASRILISSDVAYRENRQFQRIMRQDPDVRSPLFQRQQAVALLPWNITPVDSEDATQVQRAEELTEAVRQFPRWVDFVRNVEEAVWYGPSMVNLIYQRNDAGDVVVTDWQPIHPDSIAFTDEGRPGIKVGREYVQRHGQDSVVMGWEGFVRLLTPQERRSVVLHVWNKEGNEYFDPRDDEVVYKGRGMRDILWYTWLQKQTALQLWINYIERYAMGVREFNYPDGDEEARTFMEQLSDQMRGDNSAAVPSRFDANGNPEFGFKVHEPAASGTSQVYANLIQGYLAGQIKEMLIGQTATTEATNEGLGTGVSDAHQNTFWRIIEYDAMLASEAIQRDFITQLYLMRYGKPEPGTMPQFAFEIPDREVKEWMEAAQRAHAMGVDLSQTQIRGKMDLDNPIEGDAADTLPGAGMGGMGASGPQGLLGFPRSLPGSSEGNAIRAALQGKKYAARS